MNIALLHYAAPPVVGGVETVIARQAHQFINAGHQVTVITGRGEQWDANIPVRVLPLLDSLHPKILSFKGELDKGIIPDDFNEIVDQIESVLKEFLSHSDFAIVHNVASLHKNLAFTAAVHSLSQAAGSPKFILWHHDLAWTAERYRQELHPGYPWDLLRIPFPGVRQVTISEARRHELADLMKIPPEKISVIPGGVDLEKFLGIHPICKTLLNDFPLIFSNPILLVPVLITRRKNLELALHTLFALRKKMSEAVLIITGPSGAHNPDNQLYLSELKKLQKKLQLEDSLFLMAEKAPDGLDDVCVADLYRIADVLFLPSREEGFGIPILEAGLSRMPVFCSDIPQLKALGGENAIYFSPDDQPDYIAGLIVNHLSRDKAYQLRIKVRRDFTWNAIYQKQIRALLEEK